ncbi:hypothetical protein GGX14DRAFT_397426 [Mycena pura]|uniref:Uncharacterized protein n=1 Tax=Mycena pura TaxID=153505 RepID=A0AAD6V8H0_9AGAR|nr:hypothetical protein GGX14DRAFT_397426 [Mycena pura]
MASIILRVLAGACGGHGAGISSLADPIVYACMSYILPKDLAAKPGCDIATVLTDDPRPPNFLNIAHAFFERLPIPEYQRENVGFSEASERAQTRRNLTSARILAATQRYLITGRGEEEWLEIKS